MNERGKFIVAALLTTLIGPFRLFTDPILLAVKDMDTLTWISMKLGVGMSVCKYCKKYFAAGSHGKCEKSPGGKHVS